MISSAEKLTVILPAAGNGKRLNLPYSKEVMHVDHHLALIDYSFKLFSGVPQEDVQFVVVINESKTDIVRYLARYKDRFNISFTYQKPDEEEYTGAIKSARHLLGEANLVLLPDSVLTPPKGINLINEIYLKLNKTGFVFLCKPESDPNLLKTKGCLKFSEEMRVVQYEDKPSANLERFNGYWCAFAFKKQVFDQCISFMEQSTLKMNLRKIEIEDTAIFGSEFIEIESYKDLGSWGELGNQIATLQT